MIWAPLSEISSIGRSPIYASTFLAFFIFSILAATMESWSGFLIVRFLQALFGSPCLAIGGASMHDLFPDLTVPYFLAIWIAAAYCGPALGPLIASYLVPEKGWRWGMWEIVWLAAPTLILIVTLPETHGSTIRARRLKAASGSSSTGNVTLRAVTIALKDTIVRPVQITL
jgi:DHA1 family multidrug resistance protein-like MFS transporter